MSNSELKIRQLKMVLEDREQNIEIAARIGQTLLEQNKNLQQKIEFLEKTVCDSENENKRIFDEVNQLKHSIAIKENIIHEFEFEQNRAQYNVNTLYDCSQQENEQLKREKLILENRIEVSILYFYKSLNAIHILKCLF